MMNTSDYRRQYLELEQKAKKAQQNFEIFKNSEHRDFYELYRKEQEEHLNWFAEHFDYIEKHREYIKKSPILSKIVIDFMPLYYGGGLVAGAGFSINSAGYKIFFGDLLNLWDAGFCYEGCPIVQCEIRVHHGTEYIIKYIKNKQIEMARRNLKWQFSVLPEIGEELFKRVEKANINHKFPDMSTYRNIDLILKYHK